MYQVNLVLVFIYEERKWMHETTISHINYWDQVNSWKNVWKFWNGPLCRNKSGPSPLLNVAVYWQSSDTETCVTKLSQILANNIDNGGRGIGLRIYVRYCGSTIRSSAPGPHILIIFKAFLQILPIKCQCCFHIEMG